MATVERDRIRSPAIQEAVPWPSASWTMSGAMHATAPMDASVARLEREARAGEAGASAGIRMRVARAPAPHVWLAERSQAIAPELMLYSWRGARLEVLAGAGVIIPMGWVLHS